MSSAAPACTHCGNCPPPPPAVLSLEEKNRLEKQAKINKLWETAAWIVIEGCSFYADRKVFLAFAGVGAVYELALYALGFDRLNLRKHKHGSGCGNDFGERLIGGPLHAWESSFIFPVQSGLSHIWHHDWRVSFIGLAGECLGVRTALTVRSFFTASTKI